MDPIIQTRHLILEPFIVVTLFRTGEGLFDRYCTTGGEGAKRAGLGTGSLIGFLISSSLNAKNFIDIFSLGHVTYLTIDSIFTGELGRSSSVDLTLAFFKRFCSRFCRQFSTA